LRNISGDAPLHQRMVAEVVPPYTSRHRRNTLRLTGIKHPFQRGARNDYHDLSCGWDLNRRPSERNPQASALDHSATRPRLKSCHLSAMCILFVLLYCDETWTLLKVDVSRLQVFRIRSLRRIFGIL